MAKLITGSPNAQNCWSGWRLTLFFWIENKRIEAVNQQPNQTEANLTADNLTVYLFSPDVQSLCNDGAKQTGDQIFPFKKTH